MPLFCFVSSMDIKKIKKNKNLETRCLKTLILSLWQHQQHADPTRRLSPPANLPSVTFCLISGKPVDIWKIGLSSGIVSLLVSCCCCMKRCCCKKSKSNEAETPDGEAGVNLEEVMLLARSSLLSGRCQRSRP